MTPQGVLVVNPFGIGDVLFTTPLVRALRGAFPRSRLGYLCNRRTEPVLKHNPQLDVLVVYERDEWVQDWKTSPVEYFKQLGRMIGRIRRERFDLLVDLSLGDRYSLFLALLGIRRRIGFDYRRRGRFLTQRLTIDGYHTDHVVEYYRRLLKFVGIQLVERALELHVSEEDQRWAQSWLDEHGLAGTQRLVGLVPAGGVSWGIDAPFRRWSLEGFAAVADALMERSGARVILFGESSDAPTCQTVARLMRHGAIDVSGQTTLGRFISLLRRLELVISNDGGPLHLAVSLGIKTVSIYGPVDPYVYGPYPTDASRHRVVYRAELPCRPCYHQFRLPPCPYERACLTTITPEEVIDACADLLRPSLHSAGHAN